MEIFIDGLKLGVAIFIVLLFVVINYRIFIKLFVYTDTKIIGFVFPKVSDVYNKLTSRHLPKEEDDINA